MRLSEIAEFVVEKYPDCCMAVNNVVSKGCREEWYEEYLIDELIDFFSFEIMNMCGCGCPKDTYDMIRIVLNIREDRFEKDIKYEEVKKDIKKNYTLIRKIHFIMEHCNLFFICWMQKEL